jgi:SAM-dependent methyltransferase
MILSRDASAMRLYSNSKRKEGKKMDELEMDTIRFSQEEAARIVRESYGSVVPKGLAVAESLYAPEEIDWLPLPVRELALGLGNPVRYADLKPGEVVLDLGSGGGIDTFIAARQVGPTGRAIGIDMTDAMLAKANAHLQMIGLPNVEFRKGTMENLPLPDAAVDVIISNGVINLSTDKHRVFEQAFRVLKPGGRLVFSDSVVNGKLPRSVLDSEAAFAG